MWNVILISGVTIPGEDGRACMAAIVLNHGHSIDPKEFAKHVRKELPAYSVPLFIRFLPEVEITGTFKHKKVYILLCSQFNSFHIYF